MQTIDYSEIKMMMECPQKHYFAYILDLEPNKPQLWSILGTAVHAALDAYYAPKEYSALSRSQLCTMTYAETFLTLRQEINSTYDLRDRECEDLDNLGVLGGEMLLHYLDYYKDEHEFDYLVSEYEFLVPIPNTDGGFRGRIDGIIRDNYGEYWIAEHKTCSSFPKPAFFALDEQSLKYQWAIQELITAGAIPEVPQDVILSGYWYNGLLKKVPTRPPVLVNGKELSRAKIMTTYAVYLETIENHGFRTDEYTKKLNELFDTEAHYGNPFFFRYFQRRTPYEMRNIAWRLEMGYKERFRENRPILPAPNKYCGDCPFYEPCLATQQGGDVQDLLATLFHKKVHKERGTV